MISKLASFSIMLPFAKEMSHTISQGMVEHSLQETLFEISLESSVLQSK
jgi:hypothetical protein